jgi:hypothetical protein
MSISFGLGKKLENICSYFKLCLSKWRQNDDQGAYSVFLPSRRMFSFVRALSKKARKMLTLGECPKRLKWQSCEVAT